MITVILNHHLTVIMVTAYIRIPYHFCVAVSFSIDLELIQRQQICFTKFCGILHREQYLPSKTKLPGLLRSNQNQNVMVHSVQVPIDSLAWFLELVLQE